MTKADKTKQYLSDQLKFADSPASQFVKNFSLNFILKNLKPNQRQEFIRLLEKEEFVKIPEFLAQNIPGFEEKLKIQTQKELEKIIHESRKKNTNDD